MEIIDFISKSWFLRRLGKATFPCCWFRIVPNAILVGLRRLMRVRDWCASSCTSNITSKRNSGQGREPLNLRCQSDTKRMAMIKLHNHKFCLASILIIQLHLPFSASITYDQRIQLVFGNPVKSMNQLLLPWSIKSNCDDDRESYYGWQIAWALLVENKMRLRLRLTTVDEYNSWIIQSERLQMGMEGAFHPFRAHSLDAKSVYEWWWWVKELLRPSFSLDRVATFAMPMLRPACVQATQHWPKYRLPSTARPRRAWAD